MNATKKSTLAEPTAEVHRECVSVRVCAELLEHVVHHGILWDTAEERDAALHPLMTALLEQAKALETHAAEVASLARGAR